jgi:hypothetical protein
MTTPNVSDRPRRAWANEIQVEPIPLPDGERPDYPWVEAGKAAWEARDLGSAIPGH